MKELLLIKRAALVVLGLFFVVAGLNHFINSEIYLGMMPPWLPHPELLHKVAGGAEVLGGLALFIRPLRIYAAWGLILLLVAVFPANIHAAFMGEIPGLDVSREILWARLPFQFVFILLVWWVGISARGGDLNTRKVAPRDVW